MKRVLYGTNRRRTAHFDDPNRFFGSERGGLQTGFCYVSVPQHHATGEIEEPSLLRFEFRENPKKHLVLMQVEPTSRRGFGQLLREETGSAKKAFVFVHGYNVAFKDAARRKAQLAHDLEFDGAPIFFSWPSHGELVRYSHDLNLNEQSRTHLERFLNTVASQSGAEEIFIIATAWGIC